MLFFTAIWMVLRMSWTVPLGCSVKEATCDCPGMSCGGMDAPSALGESGANPNEFLLSCTAKPDMGVLAPVMFVRFSMVNSQVTLPLPREMKRDEIWSPSPRSFGRVSRFGVARPPEDAPPPPPTPMSMPPPRRSIMPPLPPPPPPEGAGAEGPPPMRSPRRSMTLPLLPPPEATAAPWSSERTGAPSSSPTRMSWDASRYDCTGARPLAWKAVGGLW
mmetsp:Transcript_22811/g.76601  ORF Transcript_22811/g.76601 Transcript_22811/m.76601 type:complete len:218 (+) Transcript_22811:1720-2373(+)